MMMIKYENRREKKRGGRKGRSQQKEDQNGTKKIKTKARAKGIQLPSKDKKLTGQVQDTKQRKRRRGEEKKIKIKKSYKNGK